MSHWLNVLSGSPCLYWHKPVDPGIGRAIFDDVVLALRGVGALGSWY
ncbi:MAG: hypothetical protein OXC19_23000 [Bryobacterales bacterium]|nr:hypothetical protein [Bryobacterales bacterium]